MESLVLCCFTPHAPILVPEVGKKDLDRVPETSRALDTLSREVAGLSPETVAIVSPPHLRLASRSAFPVRAGAGLSGDLSRFRAPGSSVSMPTDRVLFDALMESARTEGVPLYSDSSVEEEDWGALVPLVLLAPADARILAVNISPALSLVEHAKLGVALRDAVEQSGRRTVFIASGDMSHRLKPGAPSGYSPRGQVFDRAVVDAVGSSDLGAVFTIDPGLSEEAGEDCLWSLAVLAGTVDGYEAKVDVLSYEGSFGVGYMVARVVPGDRDPGRRLEVF